MTDMKAKSRSLCSVIIYILSHAVCIALCIALCVTALTSCSFFTDYSPNGVELTQTEEVRPTFNIERNPNQITLLCLSEGVTEGELSSLMLFKLDTAANSLVILQIPVDTFSRSGGSFGLFYESAYSTTALSGQSDNACASYAADQLISLIESTLSLPIDYYIRFSKDSLADFIDAIGGAELTVPYNINSSSGTVSAGKRTLTGDEVSSLVAYTGYSSSFKTNMDLDKLIVSSVINSMQKNITSTVLSLTVSDMRACVTTDLPEGTTSDTFIVRRLIDLDFESITFAPLATQVVALPGGTFKVVCRSAALEQVNEYMNVYKSPVDDSDFDKNSILTDSTDTVINAVYSGISGAPSSVSGQYVLDGGIVIN